LFAEKKYFFLVFGTKYPKSFSSVKIENFEGKCVTYNEAASPYLKSQNFVNVISQE
jgi:hypothetical protein